MALYPINGNDVIKPLANTTIHIETAVSNKRDVDAGVTMYVPSGYQHSTIAVKYVSGSLINDGEVYVMSGV